MQSIARPEFLHLDRTQLARIARHKRRGIIKAAQRFMQETAHLLLGRPEYDPFDDSYQETEEEALRSRAYRTIEDCRRLSILEDRRVDAERLAASEGI